MRRNGIGSIRSRVGRVGRGGGLGWVEVEYNEMDI